MMATFYLDLEGGNDANDGTTFANRWKSFSGGATAARIAAGDTIRVMGSPAPTSLGQAAQWTGGKLPASVSIASSTNASPIVVTLSSGNYSALAPVVGGTVVIAGHTTNTNANGVWKVSAVNGSTTITLVNADGSNSTGNGVGGATGTIRKLDNGVVALTSAVTKNVALLGNQGTKTNWTASANVTTSITTSDFKEGGECLQIAVGASFTTGMAAYFPTGTLDLSGYQQLSFWIKLNSGTVGAAGSCSLSLCSDAAGATPVNTFNIPSVGTTSQWCAFTIDLGTNLGSSIQSIAFNVNTDNGAQTFLLDCIFACKASSSADSLTLNSLISKNTGTEAWWAIQSINGTRVMLEKVVSTIPSSNPARGYSGTTESVTTYKRDTIKTVCAALSTSAVCPTTDTGSSLAVPITYSGGWNRTDMSTQTGETWIDGQNGLGWGFHCNNQYNYFDKFGAVRYNNGFQLANSSSHGTLSAASCSNAGINFSTSGILVATASVVSNGSNGISFATRDYITTVNRADSNGSGGISFSTNCSVGTVVQANNNATSGASLTFSGTIDSIVANNNDQYGLVTNVNSSVGSVTANGNTTAGISHGGGRIYGGSTSGNGVGISVQGPDCHCRNFTIGDSTKVSTISNSGYALYSENEGGVAGAHIIYTDNGGIVSATDQRHTASGISWKFSPTSTSRDSNYPLTLSVAKLAVVAGVAVNVNIWTRRDSTNIQGQLLVEGGRIGGVPNDVTVACTPTINTWVQSGNLTFTPTESGVVEVFFQVWA